MAACIGEENGLGQPCFPEEEFCADPNAECVFDEILLEGTCQCKNGFIEDAGDCSEIVFSFIFYVISSEWDRRSSKFIPLEFDKLVTYFAQMIKRKT